MKTVMGIMQVVDLILGKVSTKKQEEDQPEQNGVKQTAFYLQNKLCEN